MRSDALGQHLVLLLALVFVLMAQPQLAHT
jgi:hypothetical protein